MSLPDMTLLGGEDAITVGFGGTVDEYNPGCIAILELCDFPFGLAAPRTSARYATVGWLPRTPRIRQILNQSHNCRSHCLLRAILGLRALRLCQTRLKTILLQLLMLGRKIELAGPASPPCSTPSSAKDKVKG